MLEVTKLSSQYAVKDTANLVDNIKDDSGPALGLYPTTEAAADVYSLSAQDLDNSEATESRRPFLARMAWAWLAAFVEVKLKRAAAPFNFDPNATGLVVKNTTEGAKSRAQLIKYATKIQNHQHRRCVFSVVIVRDCARFIRWDRTGAILSKAFNYVDDGTHLLNFFYCLASGGAEAQGYDTTAVLATKQEIALLEKYETDNQWLREYANQILDANTSYPIYKVSYIAVK